MKKPILSVFKFMVLFTMVLAQLSPANAQSSNTPDSPQVAPQPSGVKKFVCNSKTNKCFCHGNADCNKMAASGVCWGGTTKPSMGGKECDWQHSKKPGGDASAASSLAATKGRGTNYKCNSHTMTCNCSGKADCDALTASNDCLDDVDDGQCKWKIH